MKYPSSPVIPNATVTADCIAFTPVTFGPWAKDPVPVRLSAGDAIRVDEFHAVSTITFPRPNNCGLRLRLNSDFIKRN